MNEMGQQNISAANLLDILMSPEVTMGWVQINISLVSTAEIVDCDTLLIALRIWLHHN